MCEDRRAGYLFSAYVLQPTSTASLYKLPVRKYRYRGVFRTVLLLYFILVIILVKTVLASNCTGTFTVWNCLTVGSYLPHPNGMKWTSDRRLDTVL